MIQLPGMRLFSKEGYKLYKDLKDMVSRLITWAFFTWSFKNIEYFL